MELTGIQKEIVYAPMGPMLVTAGAGSGKTRILTSRVAHLLENGIPDHRMVALTFTNKAGNEMRERIEKSLGRPLNMFIGTFHSFCVRLLRKNSGKPNFSIYATADTNKVLKEIIKEMLKEVDTELFKKAVSYLSEWKNSGYLGYDNDRELLKEIFIKYKSRLSSNNALDFDDLLYETLKILKERPDVREKLQDQFQYILVDEFQDTNEVQYKIVSILAKKNSNIMVVGDEDQCIYSWRGASIENLDRFKKDFPNLKIYKLEENFRSSSNIVSLASDLVSKNSNRINKVLFSNIPDGVIRFDTFYDEKREADNVVNEILRNQQNGGRWSDTAILMRINSLSRVFEERLRMYNIPYIVWGGFKFYERAEVKSVLDYLRVLVNPSDDVSLFNVINFPKRGIGDASIEKIRACAVKNNIDSFKLISALDKYDIDLTAKTKNSIKDFVDIINKMIELLNNSLIHLTDELVDLTGLQKYYENDNNDGEDRLENIYQLCTAIREFSMVKPNADLSSYLQTVTISGGENPDSTDNVVISTVHSVKGLEFKNVFIVGLEEGIFPSYRSSGDSSQMEEERRLLYVAITRAMRNLSITNAKSRFYNGEHTRTCPSSFLMELGYFNDSYNSYF